MLRPEDLRDQGRQLFAIWRAGREPGFLDASVKTFEQALAAVPGTAPNERASYEWELAVALRDRFLLRPGAADNDRLIDLLSQVMRVADTPFLRRSRGRCLMHRYTRTGSSADLDAAIADFSRAFTDQAHRRSDEIHTLGIDLSWARETRFDLRRGRGEGTQVYWDVNSGVEVLRGPPDLVSSIYLLEGLLAQDDRDTVPSTGPPPPDLAWREKRNLANLLLKYADATDGSRPPAERARDSARAVELLVQARDEMPAESAEYGSVISSLITAMRASPQPDPGLEDRLATALEESINAASEPYLVAAAKLNLANLRMDQGRINEAVAEYRELCSPDSPESSMVLVSLRAAEAWAYAALKRSAWEEVVEAHGCAMSLIADLRAAEADGQGRYARTTTSARVTALAASALARLGRPSQAAAALQEGRTLTLTDRLGTEPRTQPPPAGTAVYLISTPVGSDALCHEEGGQWVTTPLPGLPPDLLTERIRGYAAALDAYHRHPRMAEASWQEELDRMFSFLRDALRPLAQLLPRGDITIVPVGVLALLPLGAALLDGPPSRGVSVLPALSQRPAGAPVTPEQALTVADPTLPWAEWECAAVGAFFSRAVPVPRDASPEAILAALPPHGVVHFACHAAADLGSPLQSRLELPGGARLTVGDVLQARLPPLAMVVLSACETGLPDPYSPDEGIGFPAAFMAATSASVLSTLWRVNDLSTTLLILRFYWEWREEKVPGPLALARAQWWQRSTVAGQKYAFLQQTVTAGLLTAPAAEAMTAAIRLRSASAAVNPFAHPHHWAGFSFAS
jgi:tetratricopeptide (TPR) repeat protein